MKITSQDSSPNFRGVLNNKYVLKSLETISNHGATFAQGASFAGAALLRPAAISLTPKSVDGENKNYAKANSIASGLAKLAVAEAVILPLEFAMGTIDKNPEKFLKKETIENLKNGAKDLKSSKDYKFLAQCVKLGGGLLSAIPKSMLTIAMIPFLTDVFYNKKQNNETAPQKNEPSKLQNANFNPVFSPVQNSITFKGKGGIMAQGISGIINIKGVQEFAKNHSSNAHNISRNISNLTDGVLAGTFAITTKKSKRIEEERKDPLIYNTLISTGISILGGSAIDSLVQKGSAGFIEKFKAANKDNPKLSKYIEGINILRPTIIFALVYYGFVSYISTFAADRIDKKVKNNDKT